MRQSSPYLIDTHCHLHDREFFTAPQAAEMLERAHAANVSKIICVGTNHADSLQACNFALAHDGVFWTYGIHPEYANDAKLIHDDEISATLRKPIHSATDDDGTSDISTKRLKERPADYQEGAGRDRDTKSFCETVRSATSEEEAASTRNDGLEERRVSKKNSYHTSSRALPIAIGEIGLDYHYSGYDRLIQIHLFEQMLQLALDLDLPVALHIREAFADAFAVLDNFSHIRGVVHSFTGSKKDLRQALERGFFIGVNGLATYTTPPLPPLDCILLETDAPFLTPVPFRGTINEPSYVREVATYLSGKLGVAESKIMEQTTKNARKVFQI